MPAPGTDRLMHPELMSESELREILENRCIDFNNYQNLSRSKLIELYNRIALPLPQRQSDDAEKSDVKNNETANSVNEYQENSVFLNGTSAKTSEVTKTERFNSVREGSPVNEVIKQTPKKIKLCNSNKGTKCNGIEKRPSDEKQDESPMKKRQKITWP